MSKIKFGIKLPTSGPLASTRNIVEIANSAEKLRLDAVWVQDHISYGKDWLKAGHFTSGVKEQVTGEMKPLMFESLTVLSVVAGKTSSLQLGTGILVPAFRHPVIFAKQAATLQELSNGRLSLGIGVGDYKREFDTLYVPFDKRGKLTDEWLEVVRAVWYGDEPVNFDGQYFKINQGEFYPKPKSIPLLIAGAGLSGVSIRRAARIGDGWLPTPFANKALSMLTPDLYRQGVTRIAEEAQRAGRQLDNFRYDLSCMLSLAESDEKAQLMSSSRLSSFGVSGKEGAAFNLIGSPKTIVNKIEEYVQAGVQEFMCSVSCNSIDMFVNILSNFSTYVIASF